MRRTAKEMSHPDRDCRVEEFGSSIGGARRYRSWIGWTFAVLFFALTAGACASPEESSHFPGASGYSGSLVGSASDASLSLPSSDATLGGTYILPDGSVVPIGSGTDVTSVIASPSNTTVTVTITDGTVDAPTVQFTATDADAGTPVNVGWAVDRGEIGSISPTGLFTPTGTTGGTANVIAGFGTMFATTTITVVIQRTQNGFTDPIDLTTPGGYGGVGGSGPGGPISSSDVTALQQPPTADPSRTFLYPYDKTVWPRGLLAPLLQWTAGTIDATALAIHLQSSTFVYDGYFGRPAALGTGLFVNHPIPQDVWEQATESTAVTDPLNVSVVFLVGGAAVGPITRSWIVAPGILQGTVYYESYGTVLVKNSDFTAQDGTYVGAAVLAIKPGDTAPHVAAGTDTPAAQLGQGIGCRACHAVAAKGSSLIVQDNKYPYAQTSQYNLQTLAETLLTPPIAPANGPPYPLSWAGLSPDGTYALTSAVWMGTNTDNETELYQLGAAGVATPVAVTGLPGGVIGATPAFSPDGTHVAFTHVSGALGPLTGDGTHVVTLDFDSTALAMTGPKNVFTIPSGQSDCVGFPSFLPTNDALLVQLTLLPCGNGQTNGNTSFGQYIGTSRSSYSPSPALPAEIWWTDVGTATQHRLDALDGYNPDGTSYLPTGPNNHLADSTLNYEPTVNPAPSGGFAWVIFTSRRLYGNIATIDPSSSDPRNYDYAHQVTTKKLWVAAIDLNAPPGTDPSHPAFYLPAQELQSGNARGFWVLDPCKADGVACQSGDQCCGGYCQAGADGGLVCSDQTTSCSQYGDKCAQASNCCDPAALCINDICSSQTPPPAIPR